MEKRGKTFRIEKVDPKFADGMGQARPKECGKFVSFKAVQVISKEKAQAVIAQVVECIPMQRIEVDKDKHMRKPGGIYVPHLHKSRLVARGDLEKGVTRNDSPTVDQEGLFIICSFASSHRLVIRSGDVENVDFQREKPTTLLFLSSPRGGIPDDEVSWTISF